MESSKEEHKKARELLRVVQKTCSWWFFLITFVISLSDGRMTKAFNMQKDDQPGQYLSEKSPSVNKMENYQIEEV